jgi:hypothetical protein
MKFDNLKINLPIYDSMAIAVWDQREQVIRKSEKPTFIGCYRSMAGAKWTVNTKSGMPLAEDISSFISSTFQSYGCIVSKIPTNFEQTEAEILTKMKASKASKYLLIKINKFYTDGFAPYNLYIDFKLKVLNNDGELLKEKTYIEEMTLNGLNAFYNKPPNIFLVFELEKIFFDPEIASSIGLITTELIFSKRASIEEKAMAVFIHRNNIDSINAILRRDTLIDGLMIAAAENNLKIAKLMIEKGAEITLEKKDIDGQVYLINKDNNKGQIPIKIVLCEDTPRLIRDSIDIKYPESQVQKGYGYYVKYKTTNFKVGNSAMYYAIENSNYQLVELLLSNGYYKNLPFCVSDFFDYNSIVPISMSLSLVDEIINNGGRVDLNVDWGRLVVFKDDGYICTTFIPHPMVTYIPIDYAMAKNATKIVEILSN